MRSHESQKIRNSLVRQQPAFSQIFAPLFFFALFYPIFRKENGVLLQAEGARLCVRPLLKSKTLVNRVQNILVIDGMRCVIDRLHIYNRNLVCRVK